MRHRIPALLVVLLPLAAAAPGPCPAPEPGRPSAGSPAAPAFAPTESYERREIEGWTVLVSKPLREEQPELAERVLALLRVKLFEIARVVPPPALRRLREVRFWVELKDRRFPCMCYHVSPDWLRDNGYNPEKAGGVEIANAENFIGWSIAQPWMVLHELAHAYHDQVYGYDHAGLEAALAAAREAGTYEKVLHYDGETVRAYALNNPMEYFAEGTEAYFGTNDFYPFVRAELEKHDPRLFKLLGELWAGDGRKE